MTVKLSEQQNVHVVNSGDVYKVMREVLRREKKIDRDKEYIWIVCLNTANKILLIELIAIGSVKAVIVEPMEVFSFALQKRAVKFILVHNHPSGSLQPSERDIELTDQLRAIGEFIRVPMIEHLIITGKSYYSFVDSGLFQKLRLKGNYDLNFDKTKKLIATIKKMEKGQSETIKRMFLAGQSGPDIAKYLGLTKKQVTDVIKNLT